MRPIVANLSAGRGAATQEADENGGAPIGAGDDGLDPRAGVGAVENALRLLQLYRERGGLAVYETARLLGVVRSTAPRLLTTLRAHGFVVQDASRAYRVGPTLRELGAAI